MGWIRRATDPTHECEVPEPEPDAVWECDECNQVWETESSMSVYNPRTGKRESIGWWWVKQ